MRRELLRAKIHRATVTDTNVGYEGSLTLDGHLMEAADLRPFERVDVYDLTNGARFCTYVIAGPPGSGTVCVNGAAARLALPGDRIIIAAYGSCEEQDLEDHQPLLVHVDDRNRVTSTLPLTASRPRNP